MHIHLSQRRSWFRRPRTVAELQAALGLSDISEIAEERDPIGGDITSLNGFRHAPIFVDVGSDNLYEITDVIIHTAEGDTPASVVLDCTPVTKESTL